MALSQLSSVYPLVTTHTLRESRDFFVNCLGFQVGFEASWFVWLARDPSDPASPSIAFMHPDHPSRPPGPEAFNGLGLILTLQVDDAKLQEQQLGQAGAEIIYPITQEPWGQLRFQVRAPCGLVLDVVQQTEPQAGYWERYAVADPA